MVATPVTVAVPIAVAVPVCVSVVAVAVAAAVSIAIAIAIIATTRRGDHRRCAGACAVAALAGVAWGLRAGITGAPDGRVVAGVSGQAGRRCRAAGKTMCHLVEI